MSNDGTEFSAKNVDDAIAEGLNKLGLHRDQVDIEIISKGSRGILGFGGEPASVRITPRTQAAAIDVEPVPEMASEPAATTYEDVIPDIPAEEIPDTIPELFTATDDEQELSSSDNGAEESGDVEDGRDEFDDRSDEDESDLDDIDREMETLAQDLLSRMIELMGFEVDIVATWVTPTDGEDAPYLNLDIRGDDLGVLIGRRGETLANIQFLLRLMVNQQMKEWTNITVDVEQYKERRVQQLTQLANRMAEQVATGGRAMSLEPMPANERRIIHIALRDHPAVYTESTGEGERRKINIAPRE